MTHSLSKLGLVLTILALESTGCRIHPGTNHLLLVTRSNAGFDADSVPTVLELSLFGRSDAVHGPTFEEAQTPPVVTSFRRRHGLARPTGAVFASGPAALAIASGAAAGADDFEALSQIGLTQKPQVGSSKQLFGPGEVPPMWFATAESTGIELEFFGPSFPPLVQSVHAGYRRKEFLATPLSISAAGDGGRPFVVRTPSVLAVVNVEYNNERNEHRKGDRPKRVQLFATGRAATRIASEKGVRTLVLEPLLGVKPTGEPSSDPQ